MKLSVQIIADYLQEKCAIIYSELDQECTIRGTREFDGSQPVFTQYIYVTGNSELPEEEGSFVLVGGGVSQRKNTITLPEHITAEKALEWIMEAFELYNQWSELLQDALNRDCEVDELLQLSTHIFFNNPMLLHNREFYLLAMTGGAPHPDEWSYEATSGKFIFSNDRINLYKLNEDYLQSLEVKGAAIFPKFLKDFPILICNIWHDDRYVARICVTASLSEIRAGQLKLVEYLGSVVLIALKRQMEKNTNPQRDITLLLTGMLSGKSESREATLRLLSRQGWNETDCYIFLKIELSRLDEYVKSVLATCFKLESLVTGCFAFPHENGIAAIVNLTESGHAIDDITSGLSPFLRDSLLKMGCSNAFYNFFLSAEFFLQASAALEIGKKYDDMMWTFKFENYVMRYILQYGCSNIQPRVLCSQDVLALAEHDRHNGSQLLNTLRVYLINNLNSVATANDLYIHRSTFFYRLDRIKSIIKADLKDYQQRLYVQLSLLLYDESTN